MPEAGGQSPCVLILGEAVYISQNRCARVYPAAVIQSRWQVGDSRYGQGYQEGKGSMLVPGDTCKCDVPLG